MAPRIADFLQNHYYRIENAYNAYNASNQFKPDSMSKGTILTESTSSS